MAKPVMLSDEAYNALKAAKKSGESFSDVILRKFPKGDPARILAVVKSMKPNPDLSQSVRQASKEMRKNFKMREFDFE
jgi:predicted CopG family antitoxin